MDYPHITRWGGFTAMVGGVLWTVSNVIHALKPRGCIAEECASRPMRETGLLDGTLFLLALLAFGAGAVALMIRVHRAGRLGKLGGSAVVAAVIGVTLLVTAGLVQGVFFDGDFRLMPYFVVPGVFALISGFLLLGVIVLRARVLPRPVASLLVVGSLAMLAFNEQTAQTLMALPLGMAWMAAGYVLWSEGASPDRQPAAG